MTHRPTPLRITTTTARRAAQTAMCALAFLLASCASKTTPPDLTIDPTADYAGPPVRASVARHHHTLSITVPSGGWDLLGEHIDRRFRDTRLFLTLVRPDPELTHTQAQAQFDITPDVLADEPMAVYVRVVDHGAEPNDARFKLAATIDPNRR